MVNLAAGTKFFYEKNNYGETKVCSKYFTLLVKVYIQTEFFSCV